MNPVIDPDRGSSGSPGSPGSFAPEGPTADGSAGPTGRRRDVFDYVKARLLAGQPPTVREVQQALGFRSVESARLYLDDLVRDGLLTKTPGKSRSYRLAGTHADSAAGHHHHVMATPHPAGTGATWSGARFVPLLGAVQAGQPVAALEDRGGVAGDEEDVLPFDAGRERGATLFALRVRGDSMRDAGILAGDVVIVRRQDKAEPGDIVVALVEGIEPEATVKRLARRNQRWVLEPANPDFAPIVPDPSALQILGKVIEVRRVL